MRSHDKKGFGLWNQNGREWYKVPQIKIRLVTASFRLPKGD